MCPNAIVPKYYISRKAQFYVHGDYSVPRFINPAIVLTYAANAALDRSGDLQFMITRVYSVTPSSMVTTNCDTENQMFLITYSDLLRGPFIAPHSLSVNGSSNIAPEETICSRRFVLQQKLANTP